MTPCPLCSEPVEFGVDETSALRWDGLHAHRECALRSVLGGIGHLVNHERWCVQGGDPDQGLTYRQSALRVAAWVAEHGIAAAVTRV